MSRFSATARQMYYDIILGDRETEGKIDSLDNPLDIAFVKSGILQMKMVKSQMEAVPVLLKEIEVLNKKLEDPIIEVLLLHGFRNYYYGLNSPGIDHERGLEYERQIKQKFPKLNFEGDWEKNFFSSYYHSFIGFVELQHDNHEKALEYLSKSSRYLEKLDKNDDGRLLMEFDRMLSGIIYYKLGEFDKFKQLYQKAIQGLKNRYVSLFAFSNLTIFYYSTGEMGKAFETIQRGLETATSVNASDYIIEFTQLHAMLLKETGQFEKSIHVLNSIRDNIENEGEGEQLFFNYYNVFQTYYEWYRISKNNEIMDKVKISLIKLKKYALKHPDHPVLNNYYNLATAILERHGNFTKKARALSTLQKLRQVYPNKLQIKLYLLELLMEDATISEDQDTLIEVEEIIQEIQDIEFRNNPEAIVEYFSQQILLARYNFYIQGNGAEALQILEHLKDRLKHSAMYKLQMELDKEVAKIQKDLSKWSSLNYEMKETVRVSQFMDYIQKSQQLVNQLENTSSV